MDEQLDGIHCHDAIKRIKNVHALLSSEESSNNKSSLKKKSSQSQSFMNRLRQIQITKYDIILIILNILVIFAFLVIHKFGKQADVDTKPTEQIIVVKVGNMHGTTEGGDHGDSDSDKANLFFNHTIIRVEAGINNDNDSTPILVCLEFIYSNGQSGNRFGGKGVTMIKGKNGNFTLDPNERIIQVTTYQDYRNITNFWRPNLPTNIIAGISFQTNNNHKYSFGFTNVTGKVEKFEGYELGFVRGKHGGHIDSLGFVWYKRCQKDSEAFEKGN